MTEAETYPKIIQGARMAGWPLYRIADGGWGKKPFDIGGCDRNGFGVAIEVKLCPFPITIDTFQAIPPIQLLRPHQRRWLVTFASKGARSYFCLAGKLRAAMIRVERGWEKRPLSELIDFMLEFNDSSTTGWPL